MINKIREYFAVRKQYKESKKAMTLLLLTQYSDFLEAQTATLKAEEDAYKSMSIFGDEFTPDDLKNMIASVNKISQSPELQTSYYEKVHDDTQKEKNLKVVK